MSKFKLPEGKQLLAEVPNTWAFKIEFCFMKLAWSALTKAERKPIDELYFGLVKHECVFDYSKPLYKQHIWYYKCKHYGCNTVTTLDENGNIPKQYSQQIKP